jgi:multidrug efflux pump subunit AcrA (membrane-fusion protein)
MSERHESTNDRTGILTEDSELTVAGDASLVHETAAAPPGGGGGNGSRRKTDGRQEKRQERRRQRDERAARVLNVVELLSIPPAQAGDSEQSPGRSSYVVPEKTSNGAVSAEGNEADHLPRQNGATTSRDGSEAVAPAGDHVGRSGVSAEIEPGRENLLVPADVAAAMAAVQARTAPPAGTDASVPQAVLDSDRKSSASVLDVVAAKKLSAKGSRRRSLPSWARFAEPKARSSTTTDVLPAAAASDQMAVASEAAAPVANSTTPPPKVPAGPAAPTPPPAAVTPKASEGPQRRGFWSRLTQPEAKIETLVPPTGSAAAPASAEKTRQPMPPVDSTPPTRSKQPAQSTDPAAQSAGPKPTKTAGPSSIPNSEATTPAPPKAPVKAQAAAAPQLPSTKSAASPSAPVAVTAASAFASAKADSPVTPPKSEPAALSPTPPTAAQPPTKPGQPPQVSKSGAHRPAPRPPKSEEPASKPEPEPESLDPSQSRGVPQAITVTDRVQRRPGTGPATPPVTTQKASEAPFATAPRPPSAKVAPVPPPPTKAAWAPPSSPVKPPAPPAPSKPPTTKAAGAPPSSPVKPPAPSKPPTTKAAGAPPSSPVKPPAPPAPSKPPTAKAAASAATGVAAVAAVTAIEESTAPAAPTLRKRFWTRNDRPEASSDGLASPPAPSGSSAKTTPTPPVAPATPVTPSAPKGLVEPEAPDTEAPRTTEAPDGGRPDGKGLIRSGARQIGLGTGMLATSGWRKMRARLPGAQTSLGLAAWAVAALVAVVALVGVAAGVQQKTPSVVVATAGPATINAKPGGVGTTTPAQNLAFSVGLNIIGLTAPVTVTEVNVINGSSVQQGQALLGIDPTPLEQNVASVKDQLMSAQLALASAESTAGSGRSPVSLYPIPALQGQVAIDQQLLAVAQGNSSTIAAPISGSVTNLNVQPGQVVRPGTTLLQIVDTSRIDVTAGLQLSDMQAVAVGQPADVVPTGLVGVHLPGTVVAINPSATGSGLQGSVVIETNNVPSDPLPIGTQVFVRIVATRHAAVSVPTIAVQNLDLAPAVFVVSRGHLRVTPVTVGAVDSNRAQILSGLSVGEVVAESNTQLLTNGEQVNVAG